MTTDQQLLKESADYINASALKLEKLSSFETSLEKLASTVSEKLAAAGLIKTENKDHLHKDILEGGLPKVAEAFEFVLGQVGMPAMGSPVEKAASAHELTADEAFDRGLGFTPKA